MTWLFFRQLSYGLLINHKFHKFLSKTQVINVVKIAFWLILKFQQQVPMKLNFKRVQSLLINTSIITSFSSNCKMASFTQLISPTIKLHVFSLYTIFGNLQHLSTYYNKKVLVKEWKYMNCVLVRLSFPVLNNLAIIYHMPE